MARKSRKNVITPEPAKKPVEKVWHAALYIRLSVEFNSNRGDSLETQRQIMEAYIALAPDIEIVEIYTDNGTTGRTFEREAFQRMLNDVEAGKIDCIVVKDDYVIIELNSESPRKCGFCDASSVFDPKQAKKKA